MKRSVFALCVAGGVAMGSTAFGQLSLTILHASDGESAISSRDVGGQAFGGIANFVSKMSQLRQNAPTTDVLTLSAGDNILPGNALQASIDNGVPFYDSIGLHAAGFDASVLGNHEFDLGTGVTRDFIDSFDQVPATSSSGFTPPAGARKPAFLAANLDFSADANLADIAPGGSGTQSIFASQVFNTGSTNVGVIGATTPLLPDITNPGNVALLGSNPNDVGRTQAAQDLANIVNSEVSNLKSQGVENIVMLSHLQGLNFDKEVVANLSGVDAIIAGGGGELMQDAGGHSALIPGDNPNSSDLFGQSFADNDGKLVPIATTPGGYNYIGQLVLNFDANGDLTGVDTTQSGLQRVHGDALGTPDADAVAADPFTQEAVVDPVEAALQSGNIQIATSEVALDSRRNNGLAPLNGAQGERVAETNLGNLIADAIRDRVIEDDAQFDLGITEPVLGLMNGGGIRKPDEIQPAGPITQGYIDGQLPFGNDVGYIEGVTAQRLLEVMENAVSEVENVDGRFPQISGFELTYDPRQPKDDRVEEIRLDDGTLIYDDETGFLANETFTIGLFDFLAGGGDDFPLEDLMFESLGVGDKEMLTEFIINDLNGVITAADYPEGGEGRITAVPEPATLVLLGLGGLTLLRRRAA